MTRTGHRARHGPVRQPRAGVGQPAHPGDRHLLARRGGVRVPGGAAAVRRRHPGGDRAHAPQRAAAAAAPARARAGARPGDGDALQGPASSGPAGPRSSPSTPRGCASSSPRARRPEHGDRPRGARDPAGRPGDRPGRRGGRAAARPPAPRPARSSPASTPRAGPGGCRPTRRGPSRRGGGATTVVLAAVGAAAAAGIAALAFVALRDTGGWLRTPATPSTPGHGGAHRGTDLRWTGSARNFAHSSWEVGAAHSASVGYR